MSIYPLLSPPSLTAHASNRVCNALALLQCVASHQETRSLFLRGGQQLHKVHSDALQGQSAHRSLRQAAYNPRPDRRSCPGTAAHVPLFLYPFLNTTSKTRPFEYLRLTSLGVIGALVKVTSQIVTSPTALAA